MSTTYIPNLKKNPSKFDTQIVQKLSKTTHTKIFNYIFWKFLTTDKVIILSVMRKIMIYSFIT